jgi:hypothetical protein
VRDRPGGVGSRGGSRDGSEGVGGMSAWDSRCPWSKEGAGNNRLRMLSMVERGSRKQSTKKRKLELGTSSTR